jgi:hypothetical protein
LGAYAPALSVVLLGLPWNSVAAQTGVVVQGRVQELNAATVIALAAVELEGVGTTLTSENGSFRFEGVLPGGYTLRVVAFGYVSDSRYLAVDGAATVTVELQPSPLRIDSLLVELRSVEIRGEVRDPDNDFALVNISVMTDQGIVTRTDEHGRFQFERVLEDIPLHLTVRAFGYLPLDSVIHPQADASYIFELEADPVVNAMVDVQVERLERRAAPRFVVGFRNLNRQRLLRYAGSHTLWDVLLWEYGEQRLDRVACVVIDEQPYAAGPAVRSALQHTLPEELERIEFMFRGAMLRVYTRDFMQHMIARNLELRQPFMLGGLWPLCR